MAKVAFLGLGVMGYPMARHLKAKGHAVTVYNRTEAKAERWAAENGGRSAPTPRAAAEGQEIVFSCVGNDDDLRQVMLGPDGALAGGATGAHGGGPHHPSGGGGGGAPWGRGREGGGFNGRGTGKEQVGTQVTKESRMPSSV